MLWTIAIILVLLWVLGLITSYTLGGFIHVLIIAAIALLLIRIIKGSARARDGGPSKHYRRKIQ